MPKFDLTYFDFIKRFNLSIDSIIGWSIFKISKLPLRRALHIKEVKDADRLNDKSGQGVVISSPNGLIFFIVKFDTVTSMVKRVALNIQINEKFNEDILACNIFAVNATIMALENSKLSKEEEKEILDSIFLERINKTKIIFIRNNIKYTSAILREEGFLFIADMLSEKSDGLLQKISENPKYVDYDEHDLIDALQSDSQRIKNMTKQLKKEWNDLSEK
jgi:hypothetical protein